MNKYDFEVVEKRLKTEEGLIAPNKAIIRTDTNKILSVMGEDYTLIKHKEVIDNFETALGDRLEKSGITLCKQGAVLFAKYTFKNERAIEVKVGDVVNFGVELFNSYDGSLPVGFVFTALQLVCSNGMIVPKTISRLAVKHIGKANIPNIREGFIKRLPMFEKTAERWKEWTTITPDMGVVNDFIKSTFGKRLREVISAKYSSSRDKSLWGLFSALTYYNTHEKKVHKGNEANKRLGQWNFEQRVLDRFYKYNWN